MSPTERRCSTNCKWESNERKIKYCSTLSRDREQHAEPGSTSLPAFNYQQEQAGKEETEDCWACREGKKRKEHKRGESVKAVPSLKWSWRSRGQQRCPGQARGVRRRLVQIQKGGCQQFHTGASLSPNFLTLCGRQTQPLRCVVLLDGEEFKGTSDWPREFWHTFSRSALICFRSALPPGRRKEGGEERLFSVCGGGRGAVTVYKFHHKFVTIWVHIFLIWTEVQHESIQFSMGMQYTMTCNVGDTELKLNKSEQQQQFYLNVSFRSFKVTVHNNK